MNMSTDMQPNHAKEFDLIRNDLRRVEATTPTIAPEAELPNIVCATCADPLTKERNFHRGVRVKWSRGDIISMWPFCSEECANLFWASEDDETLRVVDTPATLKWDWCHHCLDVQAETVIDIGERFVKLASETGMALLLDQYLVPYGAVVMPELRPGHENCEKCGNERFIGRAPIFFDGRPEDTGFREDWLSRIDFDREMVATVFTARADQPFMEVVRHDDTIEPLRSFEQLFTAYREIRIPWEQVVEQIKFPHPHAVNAWFMAGSTPERVIKRERAWKAWELAQV